MLVGAGSGVILRCLWKFRVILVNFIIVRQFVVCSG